MVGGLQNCVDTNSSFIGTLFQVNKPKADSTAGYNADNLCSIFFSIIFIAFERRPELAAWLTMIFIILVI
jgi:hypothetical protein